MFPIAWSNQVNSSCVWTWRNKRYQKTENGSQPVWPDWAIYWTLGNFLKPLATINLHQSLPFLGNFCKGIKIIHFSSETISGQLLWTFGNFYLVTLIGMRNLNRPKNHWSICPSPVALKKYSWAAVWPYLAIYCTLDNFSWALATINLPKLPKFCKSVKIYHFYSEINFRQLL